MKPLLMFLTLAFCGLAQALPVVNDNAANSGMITIYPDHADPHKYYIAPNVVMIARSDEGVPHFIYNEYRTSLFSLAGVIQMTLVPAYTRADLEQAQSAILKNDPGAVFSGLPFVESSLSLTGILPQIIKSNQCDHAAGLIGQEQACAMVLTSVGRDLFLTAIQRKTLFTTLEFLYSVEAVVRRADGTYVDQRINHGMAVRIEGGLIAQYPQLIND